MSLPGSSVTTRQTAPPRQAPTETGVWFVAGITQMGPLAPETVESIDDFVATFGQRESYSLLYDALDAFFQEGGSKAIVSRVVGPNPVLASHDLNDNAAAVSLHVKAKSYGAWGNNISVAVVAGVGGGTYQLQILYNAVVVEQSGDLTTQADAIAWSAGSDYVDVSLGVSANPPVVHVAAALTGGTDDYANATDAQYLNAINLFQKALGPGQISMPGRTTATAHANLIAHAYANNRRALLDLADSGTAATLEAAAATDRAVSHSDYAAAFAPWAIVPGLVAGTTRTVPYSAIQAGIIARNDNAGINPNQPSAGLNYGQANYAIGLSQAAWTDTDREALNNAGVNVVRIIDGSITTYGYRTLADPTQEANWLLLSNSRLVMAIVAKAQAIGDGYVFDLIDGKGHLFADFAGDLKGMLTPYYQAGALYGASPADAFTVDTGPQVNTPTTIAALQLCAVLWLRLSPFAEMVPIQIVTSTNTEGVAA